MASEKKQRDRCVWKWQLNTQFSYNLLIVTVAIQIWLMESFLMVIKHSAKIPGIKMFINSDTDF